MLMTLFSILSFIVSMILFMGFIVATVVWHEYVHYYCYRCFYKDKDLENIILIRSSKPYSELKISNNNFIKFYVGSDEHKNFGLESIFTRGKYVNSKNFKEISAIKLVITAISPRIACLVLYIIVGTLIFFITSLLNSFDKEIIKHIYLGFILAPVILVSLELATSKKCKNPKTDQEIVKNPKAYLSSDHDEYKNYKEALDKWLKKNKNNKNS